jgi:hypothetical protein
MNKVIHKWENNKKTKKKNIYIYIYIQLLYGQKLPEEWRVKEGEEDTWKEQELREIFREKMERKGKERGSWQSVRKGRLKKEKEKQA